jgi:hypothetical protein
MTGISSTTALGQPLHEIFSDDTVASKLQSNDKQASLSKLHLQAIKMNASKEIPKCVIRVSPVGCDAASVTHFVLELEKSSVDEHQVATMPRQHFNGSIGVVG